MNTINDIEAYALDLKHSGINCCQAVIDALIQHDPSLQHHQSTLQMAASGFRAGMGTMEATCGALIGANMILGLKTKGENTVQLSKLLFNKFNTLSGATTCQDLKAKSPDGTPLCSCDNCVRHAIQSYLKL